VTSSPLPHDQGSSGCVGCWPGKTHDGKKNTNTEFLDTKKHKHNARKMTDFLTLFPGKKEQPVSDHSTGRKLNSKKHIPPPKSWVFGSFETAPKK